MHFPELMLALVRWYHANSENKPQCDADLREVLKKIIEKK